MRIGVRVYIPTRFALVRVPRDNSSCHSFNLFFFPRWSNYILSKCKICSDILRSIRDVQPFGWRQGVFIARIVRPPKFTVSRSLDTLRVVDTVLQFSERQRKENFRTCFTTTSNFLRNISWCPKIRLENRS